MICEVFYWQIKTDVLFFLWTGFISQEFPMIIAHVGDREGGELNAVPMMTDEVLLMTDEVSLTGDVQLWCFGLSWKP